jgi:hypothetical protein
MTPTRRHSWLTRLWAAAVLSLIPCSAFLAAATLTDIIAVDDKSTSISRLAAAAFSALALFVALPSTLPLAAARSGRTRLLALVAMTVVSAVVGVVVTASEDAQAGLALLWVPLVALPLAAVIWVGEGVAASRATALQAGDTEASGPATPADRLAALAVDVAIVGAALVIPLTAMSHAKKEVAAVIVGVAVATTYFAALVSARGRTIGQSLLGLTLVDAQTLRRLTFSRSFVRSLIVVLEVAAMPTIILSPPAIADLMAVLGTGRSLTDRLLRTVVVTRHGS